MKCKDCGEEYPNLAALTKHKKQAHTQQQEGAIIPLSLCPEELKYLAPGVTVGVKVEGKYTPDGILIREVTFIR